MFGYSAFSQDALGAAGTTAASPSGLSANLSAAATFVGTLATGARFAASISCSSTLTATLTIPQAVQINLQASLSSRSTLTATLSIPTATAFTPSIARTIYVASASTAFNGSKWWNLADAKKPRGLKDPDATIDITFDWADWLSDIGSVPISDVTFTLKGGLTNVATFNSATTATVFVSGGLAGTTATIACKIKTNTTPARTDERTVYIDIADE